MAESFLFIIAERVLGKLGSATIQELGLAWGAKDELKKLEDTLTTIKAVLLDAEEQQAKNHELSIWLGRLKDVCYDADDVLEEFDIIALQRQVIHGNIMKKVLNFFSGSISFAFYFRMGHKIKKIRARLDEIAADKAKFHLAERDEDRSVMHRERETYSFLRTSDVIGRENDKENILNFLIHSNDHESVSVIPIVGIGGLGKTTLARMVYNDEKVVEHFQLRVWAYVSQEFNLKKLIRNILNSVTSMNFDNLNVEQLQVHLQETLRDRRFLLILDDVWNGDRVKWIELSNLLMGGRNGSKIVVTTRSQSVAAIMGTVPTYSLEGLPHKDCMSLFVKLAFKEGQERQHPNLIEIGEEIVWKCKGVPLAVRTLGNLLYMKTDERDWMYVKDNDIWKLEQKEGDILPALRLSYDQLPFYLKQCFAYCSMFPKGGKIDGFKLVLQWMAEGFIQPSDQSQELEDIGNKYIHELLSRSFFQDVEEFGLSFTFQMHDLVHDLALLVAQTEYSIIDSHAQNISRKVRRVSFSNYDFSGKEEVPSSLLQLRNVRTIYYCCTHGVGLTGKTLINTCVSRFKFLRVLELFGLPFEVLPSSIGSLKHLRFLNLSGNCSIKSLPNSICMLLSLQTLGLYGCVKLKKLPRDFGNLIRLRSLALTTQQRRLPEKVIGSLTSLRYLMIEECSNLEFLCDGMQYLIALRTLVIGDCERLVSLPRGMKYLTALEKLVIWNCEKLNLMVEQEGEEDMRASLGSLRLLVVGRLPNLVALPRWLGGAAANTLKQIRIRHCLNLTALPEWLEDLKLLETLTLLECPELTSLPEGMHRLTTLGELRISDCPELIRTCQRETGENWHKIAHVPDIYLDNVKI